MKSIDLSQSVNVAFSESIRQCLSEKIGLSVELLKTVVMHAGPTLVVSLMAGAVTPDGAKAVFSAVMSPESNARIEDQLAGLCSTTSSIKDLELTGDSLIMRATGRRIAVASDQISSQTGIPPQAAHVLTALVGAVLLGVLKHHVLLEEGTPAALPALLGAQLPAVSRFLTDAVAESIGFENAGNFTGSIAGKLESASVNLVQPVLPVEDVAKHSVSIPAHERAASAEGARSSKRFIWPLFGVLAAVLLGVFTYAYFHGEPPGAHLMAPSDESSGGPVTPATASSDAGVAAQSPTGSSAPLGPLAASAAAPASAVSASASTAASAPQPASNPVANTPTRNGKLVFSVNQAGVPALTGTLSSDAERGVLTDALTRKFGVGHYSADLRVDASLRPADYLSHVDEMLPLMALPHAEVAIDGTHIELSGAAANATLGWQQRLQNVFGPSWDIGQFDADKSVDRATQSFLSAMAKMLDSGSACAGADLTRVLNLQVVNFAQSSGHIPSSAKENLVESGQLLKACSDAGHPVTLDIEAFSDNVGDEQANLMLSQKRADSVRGFLIEAGVKANLLTAKGYGSARPVASNATAGGRFANRRVEFVLARP